MHCGVATGPAGDDDQPVTAGGEPCQLLFVGRLDAVKGVLVLFDAVAALIVGGAALRLTLVGDGPQRAELEAKAARLGISESVHFAGYRSQAEVRDHLAAADVFVLPSFAEGVPVSLMEAMAAQLPVVATNVGGVTELVHDGVNGLVVAPGDVDALGAALDRLVGDVDLRGRLGRGGRMTVSEDFDSLTEARRLVTLFADPRHPSPDRIRPLPFE